MIYVVVFIIFVVLGYLVLASGKILIKMEVVYGKVISIEENNKERERKLNAIMDENNRWLFDALYSIDSKVVLPNPIIEKVSEIPAEIYSPENDPMSEFSYGIDDWHRPTNL